MIYYYLVSYMTLYIITNGMRANGDSIINNDSGREESYLHGYMQDWNETKATIFIPD